MTTPRILLTSSILALLALGSTSSTAISVQDESAEPEAACCFSNPAYSGICEVQPAEGESCVSILEYLNNPMAQGKDYCGGTHIRGGWTQVECEEKESSTRPQARSIPGGVASK